VKVEVEEQDTSNEKKRGFLSESRFYDEFRSRSRDHHSTPVDHQKHKEGSEASIAAGCSGSCDSGTVLAGKRSTSFDQDYQSKDDGNNGMQVDVCVFSQFLFCVFCVQFFG